jgi:hypothetical protein
MRTKAYSQKLRKPDYLRHVCLSVPRQQLLLKVHRCLASGNPQMYTPHRSPLLHTTLAVCLWVCQWMCQCVHVCVGVSMSAWVSIYISPRVCYVCQCAWQLAHAGACVCVFISLSAPGIIFHRHRIYLHDSHGAISWYHSTVSCHGSQVLTQLSQRESHADMLTETCKYSLRQPRAVWDKRILRYLHIFWDICIYLETPGWSWNTCVKFEAST